MPYSLIWEPGGVYKKFNGVVTGAELLQSVGEVSLDYRFASAQYEVSDYLDAVSTDFSQDALNEVRAVRIGSFMSNPRINLTLGVDAYSDSFIAKLASARYDVIIDDGPHTLESMKVVVSKYSQLLTENGLLIVEDVPNIEWIDELRAVTPVDLAKYIQVYDLRGNKGRYDDILFVINKTA